MWFRGVWAVNDVLNADPVRTAVVVQLLPQQWRLLHLGQPDRPAQVRRLLPGPPEHVHAGHARLGAQERRAGHAKLR